MFLVFNGHFQLLIFQFFQIHNLFLEVSFLTESLENHHVESRDTFFTFSHSFLHSKQRFNDKVQLFWNFIYNFLNFCWNFDLFLRRFHFFWLFYHHLLSRAFWFWFVLLLLHSACRIFQLIGTFNFRNRLSFRPIQNLNKLCLLTLEIGLPNHRQRITASSCKVISIFGKCTSVRASVVTVKRVLQHSLIYFPNLDLRVQWCSNHKIIFGMEIHLSYSLSMSIVILNQSLTSQIIKFHFFVSRATGKTSSIWIELTIIDCTEMVVELV